MIIYTLLGVLLPIIFTYITITGLGKKKSKCCCQFRKARKELDDSSSEEEEDCEHCPGH